MSVPATNVINSADPATYAAAITLSDTVNLTSVCRAIYVGVGGDINVMMPDGSQVLFKGAFSGTTVPVRAKRVMSTNTTASSLVALY